MESIDGRDEPVSKVGVKVASRVEPKKALIVQGVKMNGFGFDYRDFPSDASDPF
jgi:hypothetical protein